MKRKSLLLVIVLSFIMSLTVWPTVAQGIVFPELTGPYTVGRVEKHLIDETRDETLTETRDDKRELMVTIFYPADPVTDTLPAPYADANTIKIMSESTGVPPLVFNMMKPNAYANADVSSASASYPVILFSPGLGSQPLYYTSTLENLASHGYIVMSLAHPYSTQVVIYPDGRVALQNEAGVHVADLKASAEENEKTRDALGAIWVADAEFVLDQLEIINVEDKIFAGKLDLSHIGMFGHSFGGATATQIVYQDERVMAAINMDGTMFGDVSREGLDKPFMLMRSTYVPMPTPEQLAEMGITEEQAQQLVDDAATGFNAVVDKSANILVLTLNGSAHNTFTGDMLLVAKMMPALTPSEAVGTIDSQQAFTIVNTYVLAFFDRHLKGETGTLLDGPSADYPEVTLTLSH